MITLITGMPGNGKTLWLVDNVEKIFPDRPVHSYNIPGLTNNWKPIENPEKWYELEKGAVIVIDEAQDVFPTRSGKVAVPQKCKAFEKHRKPGHDIFIGTQQPRQIDIHLRSLVQRHIHIERKSGQEVSVLFEWKTVCEDPDDSRERERADKSIYVYPKQLYGTYHSAELHTVKKKIPWFYFAIPVAIAFVGLSIWSAKSILMGDKPTPSIAQPQNPVTPAPGATPPTPATEKPVKTIEQYFVEHTPLIPGLPHTQPIYAELTKPSQVPIPAACIESKSKGCKCFTQTGNPLATPLDLCRQIVAGGLFIDFYQKQQDEAFRTAGYERPANEQGYKQALNIIDNGPSTASPNN